MGLLEQRVIFSGNGTLADYSRELLNYKSDPVTVAVLSTDYLYLGSLLPFNHKHIELGTVVNAIAANVSVQIWYGHAWTDAVDVFDATKVAGVSLARSGVIRWGTNRLKGWDREQDSNDVTGLTGTTVYNMYWARLKWSANLTSTLSIKAITQKFSNDEDLFVQYAILNNTSWMTKWKSGATNWNDQHFAAAECIAIDLLKKNVIYSKDQVLDPELFQHASVHKVAEIIFAGNGSAFADAAKLAGKSYTDAMDLKNYNVDRNSDGQLTDKERMVSTGYMSR